MDWLLLLAASLAVFLLRDAWLLADLRRSDRAWTGAWAGVQLALFAALGIAAESVSRDRAFELLRHRSFWMPVVALHLAAWVALATVQRSPHTRHRVTAAAAALLLPTPMFGFAAGGLVWVVLTQTTGLSGWMAGLATAMAWLAAVAALSVWFARRGTAAVSADRGMLPSLQFAATANLSAILLIPIQQSSESESAVAQQPVDWLATLLPLAATASLVLVSYSLHRYRSARRST